MSLLHLLSEQCSTSPFDNVKVWVHFVSTVNHHGKLWLLCQSRQGDAKACMDIPSELLFALVYKQLTDSPTSGGIVALRHGLSACRQSQPCEANVAPHSGPVRKS